MVRNDLTRHVKIVHEDVKGFECDDCLRAQAEKGGSVGHRKLIHDTVRWFKCDECVKHLNGGRTILSAPLNCS